MAFPAGFVTIPNMVTFSRVLLMPIFVATFLHGGLRGYAISFSILVICEASDFLDGSLARFRKQTSAIGKLFDPLADTITRFCMFLAFLEARILPLWMVMLFFIRDIIVAYLRSFAAAEGIVVAARWSGKAKAGVQAAALFLVCGTLILEYRETAPEDVGSAALLVILLAAGFAIPVIAAFVFRLDWRTRVRLALFSLVAFVPLLLVFARVPLAGMKIAMEVSIWVALVVTIYSLWDYTTGIFATIQSQER